MRLIPLRLWALAALSGILQVLPFPLAGPVPVWRIAFCWIALLPLLYVLTQKNKQGMPLTIVQGSALGYLSGFLWYLGNCYWIFQTMHIYEGLSLPVAGMILMLFCLYLGIYHALFGALVAALRRSRIGVQGALLLSPFVWVAVELARARITSFPWDLLGTTQVDDPLLTRLAPVTGVYGLSFVIVFVNALWLIRISLRERRYTRHVLTIAGIAFVLLYLGFLTRLQTHAPHPTATATLVQENLEVGAMDTGPDETREQKLASFANLSRNPAQTYLNGIPGLSTTRIINRGEFAYVAPPNGPAYQLTDLVVWPESPAGFRTDDPVFRSSLSVLARSIAAPLIIGSLGLVPDAASERGVRVYDSAALVQPDGSSAGRYDKIHLVPFGEYVPFKDLLFFARKLTAGVGDMDRGTTRTVFRSGGHTFGTFICYESIFGDELRHFVGNGAEVLVTISDDGWYGDSGAPWQHLNTVRMRAIENHRWILRSTNTGITASVDPFGHIAAALPRHIRASLRAPYGYEHDITFYTAHGDLFAYACALLTLAALGYSLRYKLN